ncbi:hypothetical protein F7725_007459 [Dissostichus mawsoni]|uniref:Uncharacterized protein n=1 Tax=Dissostichus mawsoni TaxID=36200 RepID=A0A7J5Y4F6_DISMA|nr:hypothetical protein F7725_007459 [Dissostichus mawsoni]
MHKQFSGKAGRNDVPCMSYKSQLWDVPVGDINSNTSHLLSSGITLNYSQPNACFHIVVGNDNLSGESILVAASTLWNDLPLLIRQVSTLWNDLPLHIRQAPTLETTWNQGRDATMSRLPSVMPSITEGSEKNDTIGFISGFIRSSLQIPAEVDNHIEIIVRFLDYRVKEQVLQQAWKKKTTYEGQTIYFNQDYTNERKQVRDVIKKLKEKNVKANSPYPAQLKVFLASGTKTFTTLMEAAPMLRDMGIHGLQSLRAQSSWTTVTGQKEKRQEPHATGIDLQFLTEQAPTLWNDLPLHIRQASTLWNDLPLLIRQVSTLWNDLPLLIRQAPHCGTICPCSSDRSHTVERSAPAHQTGPTLWNDLPLLIRQASTLG